MSEPCPFCAPTAEQVFHAGPLVLGLWDGFPVSAGHALVVPKRHVASWFDASADERAELVAATEIVRREIERTHRPDGWNIGVNVGAAGGQTVPHLHVHVIPRYAGDVGDPRGGVRHVIPDKGNYLISPSDGALTVVERPAEQLPPRLPHDRALVVGGDDHLLPHVLAHLDRSTAVDIAVAFVFKTGVELVAAHLGELIDRGGRARIVTGTYLEVTEPDALLDLLDLKEAFPDRLGLWVFEAEQQSFHPKAYIFSERSGEGIAFVGSSNLTRIGLTSGTEWNLRTVTSRDRAGFPAVQQAFENLLRHPLVKPVDAEWIETYRNRRVARPAQAGVAPEPPPPPPKPHEIQLRALRALEQTRAEGNSAGLVVLATGLGKTWLSAFDSARPEFRRILFVAHREEILRQALATFRRIRPSATLGLYTGRERADRSDVLFASIQTLGRRNHLERFDPHEFDYIVVDEFHHACAATYRRLIDYFEPKFLLGLTATPERSDGGDLLALCQENLVFRCDLFEGIESELLAPFRYFGVADDVDYRNIPWRSGRFEETALTDALATRARAQNAVEQLGRHGGARTLAFCCSVRHANFMREFMRSAGLRVAAVHSDSGSSDPRASSLDALEAGELDVVLAVDIFNEGVDLPHVDTVMMLRPTESKIVWLQQFGRGLRRAEGKTHLSVIDYVGNHRSFLLGLRTLFERPAGDAHVRDLLTQLRARSVELPPGCEVTYDLRAIEILKSVLRTSGPDLLRSFYEDFRERRDGQRPTASEMHHEGFNVGSLRSSHSSWLRFVAAMGDLDPVEAALVRDGRTADFLDAVEVTPMTKSFKMLVLLAMLNADRLPGRISIDELRDGVRRIARRSAVLRQEFVGDLDDDNALVALLKKDPIAAWTKGKGTRGVAYFEYVDRELRTNFEVDEGQREAFCELARELVDWRLVRYLDRPAATRANAGPIVCKVNHSNGRPIVFPLPRDEHPALPSGWTELIADGEEYEANLAKQAVNVVRPKAGTENVLPDLLRRWFGEDAGLPGTRHYVTFEEVDGVLRMSPSTSQAAVREGPETGRLYLRSEIPAAFGMEFSTAIWNAGFIARGGRLFLLVTLEKSSKPREHQYADHFLGRDLFEWKSQNRTTQASPAGESIRLHREKGIPVHLFVRKGRGHFLYCGELDFVDWEGEKPITVRWRLREPLSDRAASMLGVA